MTRLTWSVLFAAMVFCVAGADSVGTFRFDAPAGRSYQLQVVKPRLCIAETKDLAAGEQPVRIDLETPENFANPVPKRIRTSSIVQQRRILRAIAPEYPEEALAARVGGTVSLDVTLDVQGIPASITSHSDRDPILVNAAIDAARQWRYRSTALNCEPVQVQTQMHFDFSVATGLRGWPYGGPASRCGSVRAPNAREGSAGAAFWQSACGVATTAP